MCRKRQYCGYGYAWQGIGPIFCMPLRRRILTRVFCAIRTRSGGVAETVAAEMVDIGVLIERANIENGEGIYKCRYLL